MKAVPGIWDSFFWHSFCRRKETFDQIERNGIVKVIERRFLCFGTVFFLTSSMRTPKPIIKQWCDPLMTFHKHCSCYSLLTLR